MLVKQVFSISQTHELAALLARNLRGGEIIGLQGQLGAGKTEFIRGLALALGIDGIEVTSPSYVLEHIYPVKNREFKALSHWDLYRLTGGIAPDELADYENDPESVLVVEWPERIVWLEKALSFLIEIRVPRKNEEAEKAKMADIGECCEREIVFRGLDGCELDEHWEEVLKQWQTQL